MLVLCYDHAHVDVGDVCTFVGCCLATRGVRGLLWAKGWVWLTESWPVGLLGNSQQNCYITLIGMHSPMQLMHPN